MTDLNLNAIRDRAIKAEAIARRDPSRLWAGRYAEDVADLLAMLEAAS